MKKVKKHCSKDKYNIYVCREYSLNNTAFRQGYSYDHSN